jgi:hypothetical protein
MSEIDCVGSGGREAVLAWQSLDVGTLPAGIAGDLPARLGTFERAIERRNRREMAAGLLAMTVFAFYAWLFDSVLVRLGCALVIAGMAFVLWQLQRRAAGARLPPERWGAPCGDFYRGELVRQRDALRSAWAWYVLPMIPGTVVFFGGIAQSFPEARVTVTLTAALPATMLLVIMIWNRRVAKRIGERIDALDCELSQSAEC